MGCFFAVEDELRDCVIYYVAEEGGCNVVQLRDGLQNVRTCMRKRGKGGEGELGGTRFSVVRKNEKWISGSRGGMDSRGMSSGKEGRE